MTAPNKIIFHAERRGQNLPREQTLMKQNSRARASLTPGERHVRERAYMWIAAENLRNELIRTLGIIIAHQLFTRSQSSNSIIRCEQTRVWPHGGGGETGPCSQRPQNAGAQKRLPRSGCGCCIHIYVRILQSFCCLREQKQWALLSLSLSLSFARRTRDEPICLQSIASRCGFR
jgi:hypothetical protein